MEKKNEKLNVYYITRSLIQMSGISDFSIDTSYKDSLINNKLFSGGVGDVNPDPDWDNLPKDLLNIVGEFEQQPTKTLIFDRFYQSEYEFNADINKRLEENGMSEIPHIKIINNRFINKTHFKALNLVHGLQHITIINCDILTEIPEISNIKSLTLYDCNNIEKISTMPNLKQLYIYELEKLNTIETMPELNFLNIINAYVLKQIPLMPKLKSFISSECIELTQINMPELTILKLYKCFSLTNTTDMLNLKTIVINGTKLDVYQNRQLYNKEKSKELYYWYLEKTKPYLIPENLRISTPHYRTGLTLMRLLHSNILKKKKNKHRKEILYHRDLSKLKHVRPRQELRDNTDFWDVYKARELYANTKFDNYYDIERRADTNFWIAYYDEEQAEKEKYYKLLIKEEEARKLKEKEEEARKLKEKEKEKEEKEKLKVAAENEKKLLLEYPFLYNKPLEQKEKEFQDKWNIEIRPKKGINEKSCSIM